MFLHVRLDRVVPPHHLTPLAPHHGRDPLAHAISAARMQQDAAAAAGVRTGRRVPNVWRVWAEILHASKWLDGARLLPANWGRADGVHTRSAF